MGHPDTKGPGWNGHLIVLAADLIVDSSASQFCQLMKGIEAEPVVIHSAARGFSYMPELGRKDYRSVSGFQRSRTFA